MPVARFREEPGSETGRTDKLMYECVIISNSFNKKYKVLYKNFKNIDKVVFGSGAFDQLDHILAEKRNENDQFMVLQNPGR
jgi:hypothetical protein